MLNKEQIFNLIKGNKAPFWELFLKENFYEKPKLICKYDADELKEDADDDTAAEASMSALMQVLSIYEGSPGLVFSIKIKPKKSSNQGTVMGPFLFSLDNSPQNPRGYVPVPGQPHIGLSGNPGQGIADVGGLGYIHKSQVEQMLETNRMANKVDMERALLERDKKDWEEQKKAEEEELKERFTEYSDVVSAAEKAGKKGVLKGAIEIMNAWVDGKDLNTLGSVKNEATAEEKIIQPLIDAILEKEYNTEDLQRMVNILIDVVKKAGGENNDN